MRVVNLQEYSREVNEQLDQFAQAVAADVADAKAAAGLIYAALETGGTAGETGPAGAAGPQGVPGNAGPTGATGASGVVVGTAPITYDAQTQTVSITQASNTVSGYLSSADWTAFNAKQAAIGYTPYNATNPSNYITLTALSASAPLTYSSSNGQFSMAQASVSVSGYLSAADWATFNGKAAGSHTHVPAGILGGTSGQVLTSDGTGGTWSSPTGGVSLSANNTWTGANVFTQPISVTGGVSVTGDINPTTITQNLGSTGLRWNIVNIHTAVDYYGDTPGNYRISPLSISSITGTVFSSGYVTNPNASAQVEIRSTTKGFLPPRLTTAQRDAIAVSSTDEGLMIFNKTTKKLNVYNGTTWEAVTSN